MSTYVINKGENYHVKRHFDGYEIIMSSDGKLLSQTVHDKVGDLLKLEFCDEEVTLFDGKILKRVRDKLTIGG